MKTNRKLNMVLVMLFLLGAIVAPVAAQEGNPPDAVTKLVCEGQRGLPYQAVTETGDGVTIALYSIAGGAVKSTVDPCGDEENIWAFVEPWGAEDLNPDTMFVGTWSEAAKLASANDWPNGSAWLLPDPKAILGHPMVVEATDVRGRGSLGLNPNESQFDPYREVWMVDRALTLLKQAEVTPAQYCQNFGNELLAKHLCTLPAFTRAVTSTPTPVVQTPTPKPTATPNPMLTPAPTSTPAPRERENTTRLGWWWYAWRVVAALALIVAIALALLLLPGLWKLVSLIPLGLLAWLVWAAWLVLFV